MLVFGRFFRLAEVYDIKTTISFPPWQLKSLLGSWELCSLFASSGRVCLDLTRDFAERRILLLLANFPPSPFYCATFEDYLLRFVEAIMSTLQSEKWWAMLWNIPCHGILWRQFSLVSMLAKPKCLGRSWWRGARHKAARRHQSLLMQTPSRSVFFCRRLVVVMCEILTSFIIIPGFNRWMILPSKDHWLPGSEALFQPHHVTWQA